MYEVTIKTEFCASHKLIGYLGVCKNLHGHTFLVEVCVKSKKLNKIGIMLDFKDLKQMVWKIIGKFDHKHLNDIPPFNKINPTSENLAKYIYNEIQKILPKNIKINWVKVGENKKSYLTYYK